MDCRLPPPSLRAGTADTGDLPVLVCSLSSLPGSHSKNTHGESSLWDLPKLGILVQPVSSAEKRHFFDISSLSLRKLPVLNYPDNRKLTGLDFLFQSPPSFLICWDVCTIALLSFSFPAPCNFSGRGDIFLTQLGVCYE